MGAHENGSWGRPVGQKNHRYAGNAKAWCYVCSMAHSYEECILSDEQRALILKARAAEPIRLVHVKRGLRK